MSTEYSHLKKVYNFPRLPLETSLDLTYRCNNNCRHCWLRISPESHEIDKELSFEEIKHIVDEARQMGCREWSLSGGEPMLRPDFVQIFDYITSNSISYSINTNGTMITPKIAKLLKRKGVKMVALYGATAQVHDHITRNRGSFEATMRGFSYLKEADTGFIVQVVPMKDNYHQFKDMVKLAESLGPHYRIGASWLYLSACGDSEKNKEIIQQRLPPKEVVKLDKPDMSWGMRISIEEFKELYGELSKSECFFDTCIDRRRESHIDPYGQISFCSFVKESALRYDLREGSFEDYWERFLPSLSDKVKHKKEYLENCASCELRNHCKWCPVYGYLEHRRFEAKIEYLCDVARENKKYKDNWRKKCRRYYQIAGMNIQVDSDLSIKEQTFHPKFKQFEIDTPGDDLVSINHHFFLPSIKEEDLGRQLYHKAPWAVYKRGDSWIYVGILPHGDNRYPYQVAVFNRNYTRGHIYHEKKDTFLKGNLHSLTLFPTDQILLANLLADREGCYLHSSGVILDDKGLLFVGHSEAGKSTIVKLLKGKAKILCDDRMIIRRYPEGFKIYGTWSHGDVPDVSGSSASLRAILFLEKAKENKIIPMDNKKEINKHLLSCLIKPFVTAEWWEKTLGLIERVVQEVPCYVLKFDKSIEVVGLLKKL